MSEHLKLHHNVVFLTISFGTDSSTFMAYPVLSQLVAIRINSAIMNHALLLNQKMALNWGTGWNLVSKASEVYRLLKDINNRISDLFDYFSAVYNEAGCYVNKFQQIEYLNEKIIQHFGAENFPTDFKYTNIDYMQSVLGQLLTWKNQLAKLQEDF